MLLAVKSGKEFGCVEEINSVAEDFFPPSLFNVRYGSINYMRQRGGGFNGQILLSAEIFCES